MSMPCLPAYGGYCNVWLLAVKRQQVLAKACKLALPQLAGCLDTSLQTDAQGQLTATSTAAHQASEAGTLPLTAAADVPGSTGSSNSAGNCAWADTLEFAQQYGCTCDSLPTIMANMPRSKTEKVATKQAMAVIKAKIEPSACDLAETSSKGSRVNKPSSAAAGALPAVVGLQDSSRGTGGASKPSASLAVGSPCCPAGPTAAAAAAAAAAPLLQEVTKLHLLAFSSETDSMQQHWSASAVELEAPVLPADTAAAEFAGAADVVADTVAVGDVSACGSEASRLWQTTAPAILSKVTSGRVSCKPQTAQCSLHARTHTNTCCHNSSSCTSLQL
jgi:hypothetical protein